MATQSAAFSTVLSEFAAELLAEREVYPRARVIANRVAALLPGAAVIIYVLEDGKQPTWGDRATVGAEVSVAEPSIPCDAGTLGLLWQRKQPFVLSGAGLRREDYAHLHLRRTVVSLAYFPLMREQQLLGAIEVISLERAIGEEFLAGLEHLAEHAALGLATAVAYENERNSQFKTISRLTQLYDLERVFNSTLQMDRLLPVITAKIQEILEVQGVNLWMVQDDDLLLVSRSGDDETVAVGAVQRAGQGIAAQVADSGKAVLVSSASDPRLAARNASAGSAPVRSLVAAPIVSQDALVGVLEIVNRMDGRAFDEDDAFFLSTISLTAASALHNASLLEAERKIEILETLVKVSQEITSTLNLDRVLQVLVNAPQVIIPFERCAVAMERKGKLQLKAVSGIAQIKLGDPKLAPLKEILEWAAELNEELHVTQHGKRLNVEREETRAKFEDYFRRAGSRGFYAVPLADDQGRLGILTFESSNPDFLNDAHFEIIKVLASQATVTLRNAELYQDVPLIGVLEPILQRKQRFMRMEARRRKATVVLAIAAAVGLVVVPLPMRVAGNASVAALRTASIQPEVPGVIKRVLVQEGDHVARGAILADLEDWEYRAALAAAEARYSTAISQMNRALALNDGSEAGVQRAQADYWNSEVARARERLEKTHLRAPVAGLVTTPHIENLVGQHLDAGDKFAEVADTSRVTVDVAVDGDDLTLVEPGQKASVKLESFPIRKFTGTVTLVSPTSTGEPDRRVFFARADLPNPDGLLRPGMQGRSKISTGWRPAGYVMFRGFGMWFWSKLWGWFGS